jgi:hypothetical protein
MDGGFRSGGDSAAPGDPEQCHYSGCNNHPNERSRPELQLKSQSGKEQEPR